MLARISGFRRILESKRALQALPRLGRFSDEGAVRSHGCIPFLMFVFSFMSNAAKISVLHTFEKVPRGGVASPHTENTLAYIQELKGKHGIEYDTHASYRFVEKTKTG